MPRFEVRPCGSAYAVFNAEGERVSGLAVREHALTTADNLEALARMKPRKCLSCGAGFMSEGAHNRMCQTCRDNARDHAQTYELIL